MAFWFFFAFFAPLREIVSRKGAKSAKKSRQPFFCLPKLLFVISLFFALAKTVFIYLYSLVSMENLRIRLTGIKDFWGFDGNISAA